ncbi:MAG: hypothetical protein AB1346_02140, partial [Thermodesulfobacteriota bacterium]
PLLRSPFFMDLIDTAAFPPPIVSSDYSTGFLATVSFDFINSDQSQFVFFDVTSLMQQAQALLLPSFRVRIGFDNNVFNSDLTKTRGLVEIEDGPNPAFAPELVVEFF